MSIYVAFLVGIGAITCFLFLVVAVAERSWQMFLAAVATVVFLYAIDKLKDDITKPPAQVTTAEPPLLEK